MSPWYFIWIYIFLCKCFQQIFLLLSCQPCFRSIVSFYWYHISYLSCVASFQSNVWQTFYTLESVSTREAKYQWRGSWAWEIGVGFWYRILVQDSGQDSGKGFWYRILVQDSVTGFWCRILVQELMQDSGTGFWYKILVQDSGTRFWYRILVQDSCTGFCYRILVQDSSTEICAGFWYRILVHDSGTGFW